MSVIAKMSLLESVKFGDRYSCSFSVVCESALMAQCGGAAEDEDILFTNASPGQLNFPSHRKSHAAH